MRQQLLYLPGKDGRFNDDHGAATPFRLYANDVDTSRWPGVLRYQCDVNTDVDRVAAPSEVYPFHRAHVVVIAPPGEDERPIRRDEIIGGVKINPARAGATDPQ